MCTHIKTNSLKHILHIQIPDLPLGTRHCLHKEYSYRGDVASLFQMRFFNIGSGYESTPAFLAKARCGHTYKNKTVETTTHVEGSTPVCAEGETRSVPDNKSVTGILHAATKDRISFKNAIKQHRSEPPLPATLTFNTNTNPTSLHCAGRGNVCQRSCTRPRNKNLC